MITGNLDTREFSQALRDIMAISKKEPQKVLRGEAKLAVRDAVRYTPPFGKSPIHESFKAQQEAGKAAIKRELIGGRASSATGARRYAGIFLVAKDYMLGNKPSQRTVRLYTTKDGKVYGVEKELFQPNASTSDMSAHHKKFRGADGHVTQAGARTRDVGRWRFVDKMVVSAAAMNRYLRFVWNKVGIAKSGWKMSAQGLGLNLPNWITKHSSNGVFMDTGNKSEQSVTIGNLVSFIQKAGGELRIMQRVLNNRVYSLRTRLEQALKRMERHNGR